ncbi:MAG: ComEC/Rec2 family competence protein, partial [Deltaproteobacteria bacterium]|nr:ComEC/Rec2 family competence protein [Deltaproteobacteria bacterium]
MLYGMLSGVSPSTQRAVIMVSVFLITFLFDKEHDPINTLALAAFVILTIHPPSLFSISFQLSFITVYFIIYGLSRVNYLNAFHLNWDRFQMCKKILTFLMVSFFAFVGSFPIVMFYFNQVSTVGILANLFVIPLIGFVAVPLGLTSVFLYPIYQPLAAWNLKWSSYVIKKSFSVINFLSDLPFAAIKTITPTILEIICFYLLIWALINLNKNKIVKYLAIGVIFVLIADVAYWVHQRFLHDDLRVTIIDVGQGSSALLEIPGGQTVLIDGGGFSDNSYFDIGERVVGPFLWRKKIKTVDTIILSHPNSDHLNGLIYIAKHFNVKNVWTNGETASTFGYQTFMEVIKEQEINIPVFEKLSRKTILNGVILEIIYPENDFLSKRETDRWRNRNNNSLVLRAKFGSTSIIFPGDLEARAEIDLASIKGNDLKSTILV